MEERDEVEDWWLSELDSPKIVESKIPDEKFGSPHW